MSRRKPWHVARDYYIGLAIRPGFLMPSKPGDC